MVTDWITAISTLVLAIAAPVSVGVLVWQIRRTQATAIDERHYSITPHIALARMGASEVPPRPGALTVPYEPSFAEDLIVEAIGLGVASAVAIIFKADADPLGAWITPSGFTNLVPGSPRHISVVWLNPAMVDEAASMVTYIMTFSFTNALGRLYEQTFAFSFHGSDIVLILPDKPLAPVPISKPHRRSRLRRWMAANLWQGGV